MEINIYYKDEDVFETLNEILKEEKIKIKDLEQKFRENCYGTLNFQVQKFELLEDVYFIDYDDKIKKGQIVSVIKYSTDKWFEKYNCTVEQIPFEYDIHINDDEDYIELSFDGYKEECIFKTKEEAKAYLKKISEEGNKEKKRIKKLIFPKKKRTRRL